MIKAAEKEGKTPKQFLDEIIPQFKGAWKRLDINYDRFIRTSDEDHKKFVEYILEVVYKKGDIYKGKYEGLYCSDCEAYYTEKDAPDLICPIHKRPIEKIAEESYFFKLSKYQKQLLELYKKNPEFILPLEKKNEILNRVKEGLKDLSISRKNQSWGIKLPFDKEHVAYVWFDALTNYVSGIGYLEDKKLFEKFWPCNVHLVGKDILWFHSVIWPAMLFSAGIEQPKCVFAHGWWSSAGNKIGKSAGNAMDLDYLINTYGTDSIRYFIFRSTPFGLDGEFSETSLCERHNTELANKLGNLVSRVSTLAEKYGLEAGNDGKDTSSIFDSKEVFASVKKHIDNFEFDKALNEIFACIDKVNEFVQSKKPWETKDKKVLWQASNAIKDISILLSPFIPSTSQKIADVFNFKLNLDELNKPLKVSKVKKADILFKKVELSKEVSAGGGKVAESSAKPKNNSKEASSGACAGLTDVVNLSKLPYEHFAKLDLKVGKILEVNDHPKADKLFVLKVDINEGEPRTIVAGLKKHYSKEDLIGKKAIFVANLAPANIRGVESNGMILAAVEGNDEKVAFLSPEKDLKVGSKVE